ncbi:hypothetical protein A6I77_05390 [Achromobacter xylosoxidans]|nr:hypothetical protein A6I77_05390 [Achromobacter xylosoxidans]
MIVVNTKHPQKHLDAIISAAKSTKPGVSETWSVRKSTNSAGKEIEVLWHDTQPDQQWSAKGEFWYHVRDKDEESEIVFGMKAVPPATELEAVHYEKLHGRLTELILTYFRAHRDDFNSLTITRSK